MTQPTEAQLRDLAHQAAFKAAAAVYEGANATPKENLQSFRDLPKNIDGNPEFSNVILTLDHLQAKDAGDGHIRNKMVFSTETTSEVMAKLLHYYQVPMTPARFARVLEVTGAAATQEYNGGILVLYLENGSPYEVGDRGPVIEVILSTVTYDNLVRHSDFGKNSSLLASDALVRAVQDALLAQRSPDGQFPLVTYLQIHQADFVDSAPLQPVDETSRAALHPGDAYDYLTPNASSVGAPNSVTGGQDFPKVG